MTLTDALGAALHPVTGEPRDHCSESWAESHRRAAAAILADPAFREALTAALAEQLSWDWKGSVEEQAAAIVAAMLP